MKSKQPSASAGAGAPKDRTSSPRAAQARAQRPDHTELTVGRGVGWRCELDSRGHGLFLYLGRAEVDHWPMPKGMRATVADPLPSEDFFRIYLAADPAVYPSSEQARSAVRRASSSLRSLAPYNPYRGQGLRTWADKNRPRRVVKKSQ